MSGLIVFGVLMTLGYFFGVHAESRHFKSIFEREARFKDLLIFDSKRIPDGLRATGGGLVQGHVVVSVDYFKRFVAGLRMFFGGNLKSYESLLDRARREAILRMKEQARLSGANMIFNVKFETSSISKGQGDSIGCVEVYVYGSAFKAESVA